MVTPPPDSTHAAEEWASSAAAFSWVVKRIGASRGETGLLAALAAELERHLADDGPARDAVAGLDRLGLAVLITLDTVRGPAPPRVRLPDTPSDMPEWSPEDEAILRSLGIAGGSDDAHDGSTSKPGGRQPD